MDRCLLYLCSEYQRDKTKPKNMTFCNLYLLPVFRISFGPPGSADLLVSGTDLDLSIKQTERERKTLILLFVLYDFLSLNTKRAGYELDLDQDPLVRDTDPDQDPICHGSGTLFVTKADVTVIYNSYTCKELPEWF